MVERFAERQVLEPLARAEAEVAGSSDLSRASDGARWCRLV